MYGHQPFLPTIHSYPVYWGGLGKVKIISVVFFFFLFVCFFLFFRHPAADLDGHIRNL
jgi:hypothetical protein